jgi:hypothetical protein
MKKIIWLLATLLGLGSWVAQAQNIVIGQKSPELKNIEWLEGHEPVETELTCIVFFHSSNRSSIEALRHVDEMAESECGRLRIIVVTQEPVEKIEPMLKPYLSERLGVVLDPKKKVFGAFGVHYVPLGVLLNARNRVEWVGNPQQLIVEN